jgi:hypothetical protein
LNPGYCLGKAMSYHWTTGARTLAPRLAVPTDLLTTGAR